MGRIQTLIIGAGVAFLVSGLLSGGGEAGGGGIDFDSLLTMAFLVYIWYTIRWAASSKNKKNSQSNPPEIDPKTTLSKQDNPSEPPTSHEEPYVIHINKNRENSENPPSEQPQEASPVAKKPMASPIPGLLGSLRVETIKIIHHKAPWSIVERGATIGRFRNTPIPAWIRTSDDREADYHGITDDLAMDGTVCIEIPESSELILSPGLVYLLRS
ncbi:MAG: hypothetical protein HQL69_05060 [Magnetococcales bacterium]|nr:hypothetical protein [Magnetococcales bacterium]